MSVTPANANIRVAMIGQKGYPPVHGGIEKHVAELAARLPGHGVEVHIYSRPHYSDFDGPADLPGVPNAAGGCDIGAYELQPE